MARRRSYTTCLMASFIVAVLVWLIAIPAVSAAQSPAAKPETPITGAAYATQSIAEVKAKIEALSAAKKPNTPRAQLLTLYRQTLSDLKSARLEQNRAAAYVKTAAEAPAKIKTLQKRIEVLPEQSSPADLSRLSINALESRLTQAKSKANALQARSTKTKARESAEQAVALQQSLAQAESALQRLPAAAPVARGSAKIDTARRGALAAKRRALQAKVQMLQQRLATRDDRLSLLHAKEDLISRQLKLANARAAATQAAADRRRRNAANRTVRQAEKTRVDLKNQPDIVRHYAEHNAALGRRLTALEGKIARAIRQENRTHAEVKRISRNYHSLAQQLQIAGLDASADFGALLRRQRDKLPAVAVGAHTLKHRRQTLIAARLEQFRIDQHQDMDVDDTVAQALAKIHSTTPSAELKALLRHLARRRQSILRNLAGAYNRYINALAELNVEAKELVDKTRQYKRLLNERLFWIPSAPPVSWATWTDLKRAVVWLFQPAHWRRTAAATSMRITARPLLAVLALLVLALLVWKRRQLKLSLAAMKDQVGKVGHDRFGLTLEALLITVLLASPGPLLLGVVGWLFQYPGTFLDVLATGVMHAAALLFLLDFFFHTCRPDGLAEVHFKWSAATLAVMRRNLPWLMIILVPITVVTSFTEGPIVAAYRNSLGRLVFVIASIALALFAHYVLRPKHGVLSGLIAQKSSPWRWQLHYIVYPAAVIIPLILMALALYGYHYTALSLEDKLFISACVIVAGVLVFYVVVRAVAVTERRMALRRVRAKRAAAKALNESREAAESAGEGMPELLDVPEVDLEAISEHSRALLRLLATLGIATGLWLVWLDIFPALGVLNDITLWHVTATVSGAQTANAITLQDLILAMVAGFLTLFAARNLPGTLQVAFLGRFSIAPGTSHAITTLCRYAIVIIGVVAAFKLVGAQWAKLQWLVAALGVGLGFGLQEIFANFMSGMLILFERPIRVGDTVTVGEHTGTVSRIRIRATTITDWDRKEQIIPNKTFITGPLTNWTLTDPITRIVINVRVAHGSDIELVHRLLLDITEKNPMVTENPPPSAFFVGFGESSLNFEIRVFVKSLLDFMPLTHELHTTIYQTLKRHGIEIPFPQRDLHIRSEVSAAPIVEDTEVPRKRA